MKTENYSVVGSAGGWWRLVNPEVSKQQQMAMMAKEYSKLVFRPSRRGGDDDWALRDRDR